MTTSGPSHKAFGSLGAAGDMSANKVTFRRDRKEHDQPECTTLVFLQDCQAANVIRSSVWSGVGQDCEAAYVLTGFRHPCNAAMAMSEPMVADCSTWTAMTRAVMPLLVYPTSRPPAYL